MRNWQQLDLWQTQVEAIRMCEGYFADPETETASLVQMPTGAGKTGVIAVLAAIRSTLGAVMVVTPSEALVQQLMTELREKFWATIAAPAGWKRKHVELLLPRRAAEIGRGLAQRSGLVLVGTLQALQRIKETDSAFYTTIRGAVQTVLVDEGHREPAESWGQAIRSLDAKVVLFSATPYRNDQRAFNVSANHHYRLSFDTAVRDAYIRDVEFRELSGPHAPVTFAEEVFAWVDQAKRSHRLPSDAKVIVHAADMSGVKDLVSAFRLAIGGRVDRVVGFHDQFTGQVPGEEKKVEDLARRREHYFIHQFKLLEGLDDPRCMVIALFDDLSNGRLLVQQIGRVLRNPGRATNAPRAVVLHRAGSKAPRIWEGYRTYDQLSDRSPEKVSVRTHGAIDELLKALPEVDYVNGDFRRRVEFDPARLQADLRVPRSCVIYEQATQPTIDTMREGLERKLRESDRFVKCVVLLPAKHVVALVSLVLADTEYLADGYFPEIRLEATVARYHNGHVFLADTRGLQADSLPWIGRKVSPAKLQALFPTHRDTRLSQIAAHNTDIGAGAVRSRTLAARSLVDTTSFMGEDLHVVTRATGTAGGIGGRYVGFSRSRVRDGSGGLCSIEEFCRWTDSLAGQLSSGNAGYDYFQRFSSAVAAPTNPAPVNVLLDLNAIKGTFARSDAVDTTSIDDICSEVVPSGTGSGQYPWEFRISLNGHPVTVAIAYEPTRGVYEIASADLAQFIERANPRQNLVGALNKEQAFRIITATSGVIYVAGDFYDIASNGRLARMRTAVLSLLHPLSALQLIKSEKGTGPGPGPGAGWSAGSLFEFIDQKAAASAGGRRVFGSRFEHLVCDDLNDEVADFIGLQVTGSPRIAFIHAKAKPGTPGAGASDLYDVCAQAAKNLVYVRFGASPLPSNVRKWNGDWHIDTYVVDDRIRCGGLASAALRSQIEKVLENPRTTREVWIALGSILSSSKLEADLRRRVPRAPAMQAAYLLTSLDSACKSVGVELKVFCSP